VKILKSEDKIRTGRCGQIIQRQPVFKNDSYSFANKSAGQNKSVPHYLNAICLYNQRMYYDILFAAVWNTLYSFGYSHYGTETGAVAVLHTWGQNLSLHPHIHCIVPATGYTLDGQWKEIGHSGKYLYPVHQLSDTFKGKFLDSLKRALRKQDELLLFDDKVQAAYKSQWVVHSEPSMVLNSCAGLRCISCKMSKNPGEKISMKS